MPLLIEVAFRGNRKDFFLWDGDEPPPVRSAIIVDADRGEDLGRVHATGELATHRSLGVPHGVAIAEPSRRALRLATPDDVARAAELVEQNDLARRKGMERVKANGLVMKLSDAEWQWDRKKLTFYFTAEKRVDFRNLVRDLASMFRTRIELKQIGVRDEAKRLDGVGRCGRQYCSASWLPELRPVNLGVAKDQRLSLNPSQISGSCGRLMCCLRYEHDFYVQSRKRFPKEGKILATTKGEEKVVANDIFGDRVTLRTADGETRVVALADLTRELRGEPGDPEPSAAVGPADEILPDEESTIVAAPAVARRPAPPLAQIARAPRIEQFAPAPPAAPAAPDVPLTPPAAPPDATEAAAEPAAVEDDAGSPDESDAALPGESAESAERRLRRRRGRRGGRRGRGGAGDRSTPAQGE